MKHLTVEGVLGPHGALSAAMEHFEYRTEQVDLATAVAKAIENKVHLIAEAGTGTGKTLAYLVPTVLSQKKTVISTATKTLQDQLFFKDIPLLQNDVGLKFNAALLKGRSNYLCLYFWNQFSSNPQFATPEEAKTWPAFSDWVNETESGDRGEAPIPDNWSAWPRVSTHSDNCLGSKCPYYEDCYVTRAREQAQDAQLVVVNHALFFSDLALRAKKPTTSENVFDKASLSVLPKYEVVVFDEAHAIEGVATEHFGISISSARLASLCNDAVKAFPANDTRAAQLSGMALAVKNEVRTFFSSLAQKLELTELGDRRLTPMFHKKVVELAAGLQEPLQALATHTEGMDDVGMSLGRRAHDAIEDLKFLIDTAQPNYVYWVQRREKSLALKATPVELQNIFEQQLFPHAKTIIFTSATLALPSKKEQAFDFASHSLGLDALPHDSLQVSSPFKYETHAALYLPKHLPEPQVPHALEAYVDEIEKLVTLTKGRAFVLFTSLRQMQAVHQKLGHRLPYRVLLQGEQPKSALLDIFKSEPSVLFASASFWEGVDVPGDALSLVIIDKLPFAVPDQPQVAARIETMRKRGGNAFGEYQLPQAALALRQGFGRLIRTKRDTGIVALLDNRIHTRKYGTEFIANLPPAHRVDEWVELEKWWAARPKS